MSVKPKIAAYYYPGWHPCKVRDQSFPKGWSEWDLLPACKPSFDGQYQPRVPVWGYENEAKPEVFEKKISTANEYGVDAFVFAYYWSRGKRLLEGALEEGLLKAANKENIEFALMWANRMPRKVMPIKCPKAKLIDPSRLVFTDPNDFVEFIEFVSEKYFCHKNYMKIEGKHYLSIFDTAFFIKQVGVENARLAIEKARTNLAKKGMELHLAAIDPIPDHQPLLKKMGFDSVTHYVFLPDWKGPKEQDFTEMSSLRVKQWATYQKNTELPYYPSVTPGWDANPRAVDYGKERPSKYPWSPVITGACPENFEKFLKSAVNFALKESMLKSPMVMISSWNEWSEGHYLEPDQKYGYKWLEAVKNATNG